MGSVKLSVKKAENKMQPLSQREPVMFSAAFDKLVYGEGKYYRLPLASCHFIVMYA